MQDAPKAVWSIPYVSVALFPSLKQNFIVYRSSKVSSRPDCIFEIHQLWQSGFHRVYSNCCCSYSFEFEIVKIGQSSHKMYSHNIPNFQESTTILNACTKTVWKLIECTTYITSNTSRGCSRGVMVNALYCEIVECEFELQWYCYIHFWTNTLGKDMNPFILPAMG